MNTLGLKVETTKINNKTMDNQQKRFEPAKRYKTLTYNDCWVNVSRLEEGIYFIHKPILYSVNVTKEDIVELFTHQNIPKITNPTLYNNIALCRLTEIELTIKKSE